MKKKICTLFCLVISVIVLGSSSVSADSGFFTPYSPYEYNYEKQSIASPASYVCKKDVNSSDMGLSLPMNQPSDIYSDGNHIFVLDSGNSRIIELSKNFELIKLYDNFIIPAALSDSNTDEKLDFAGAQGFTVGNDGSFYIADTEHQRIVIISQNRVQLIIKKPETKLLDSQVPFRVTKVILNTDNKIYAVAESINLGVFVFTMDGEFIRFIGSNKIVTTQAVLMKYIEKKFMSKAQLDSAKQYTPVNVTNFDIDKTGFLVTVTQALDGASQKGAVCCFNYNGNDILNYPDKLAFGDFEQDRKTRETTTTRFSDVDVDDEGFYFLLDSARGRIFSYTNKGDFVCAFSQYGEQKGLTGAPVALETIDDNVVVLDNKKNCIEVFSPTDYVKTCRDALMSFNNGKFNDSLDMWNKLLKMNTNNDFAYFGIGEIYDTQGNYNQAMDYFKLAHDQDAYSQSFKEYRKLYIREHLIPLLFIIVISIVLIRILVKKLKKRFATSEDEAYTKLESKNTFPFYVAIHPADGFAQFKMRKIHSMLISFIIIFIWFVLRITQYFFTGYIFNNNNLNDYNIFITMAQTIGAFMLFVISNWAVCTLIEGKGTLKEIIATSSYSLVPYLISMFLCIILSNVLAGEESSFLVIIQLIGIVWSAIVLFVGLYAIHQYSTLKTVASIIFTFIGMAIIIFLIILFVTLLSQSSSFISSVIQELLLRK